MVFSKKKRKMVYDKTGGRCAYCGISLSLNYDNASDFLNIDHVHPQILNGGNEMENLLPACKSCNSTKMHKTLEEYRVFIARRKNNIPIFSNEQSAWLTGQGVKAHIPPHHTFFFEE